MSLPIEEIITDLRDSSQPIRNTKLVDLSNLNSEEVEFWQQVWADIKPKRRRIVYFNYLYPF